MHALVKTVALTAAGHLVAPAAGKATADMVQILMTSSKPKAMPGSARTGSQLSFLPMGNMGGTKAIGIASSKLVKVKTPTEMWTDFRAQTKDPAWKQPESKAIQHPNGLWCCPSGRPKRNSGWLMQIAPASDSPSARKCITVSFSPKKMSPKKAAAMMSMLVSAATSPGDAPMITAITAKYQWRSSSRDRAMTHFISPLPGRSILKKYTARPLKNDATMQAPPWYQALAPKRLVWSDKSRLLLRCLHKYWTSWRNSWCGRNQWR